MKYICLALLFLTSVAAASPQSQTAAVLSQETRWLTAIVNGDRPAIASILSPAYKHISAEGTILNRAQELASTAKEAFKMKATQQTVDFVGDVAIVRGVNTITQSGKILARVRFTDVFVKRNGTWMALSAQETTIR